jgi:VanZ family protein
VQARRKWVVGIDVKKSNLNEGSLKLSTESLKAISANLKKRSRLIFIILFICCAIAVIWGVFRSTPPQHVFHQSDKILHLLAFAVLAFTGRIATLKLSPFLYWPTIAVIAVSIECVQGALQTTRISSLEDALANLLGVGLAFVAVKIVDVKVAGGE